MTAASWPGSPTHQVAEAAEQERLHAVETAARAYLVDHACGGGCEFEEALRDALAGETSR